MRTPFWREVQVLLINRRISFRSYEFLLMFIERTPSARTGRHSDKHLFNFFLHLISTQSTCQKVSTFSLIVGQYSSTHPPDNRGKHLLQMPQQGSFFSYISPGSVLGTSRTDKLVYNFPWCPCISLFRYSEYQIKMTHSNFYYNYGA